MLLSRGLIVLIGVRWAAALDNGLARRPVMGWSTWNSFQRNISDALFYNVTDALVASGMRAAGYEFINIDGGWWEGSDEGFVARNASGFVLVSAAKFPGGLAPVIDYVHAAGFKYGHYTDAGTAACNGDAPMSEGFEPQDATLFASWAIDMIKIDSCATSEGPETLITRWQALLNASGRPILLSDCRNGCLSDADASGEPWAPWCAAAANMWRTSRDIAASWVSMLINLDSLKGRGGFAAPGRWNDPDILEVGVGEFAWPTAADATADDRARALARNRAHFALWCVTSSPLIAGHDPRDGAGRGDGSDGGGGRGDGGRGGGGFAPELLAVLVDADAIAVDQAYHAAAANAGDALAALNASATSTLTEDLEVWVKPLAAGRVAAVLLNRAADDDDAPPLPLSNVTLVFADLGAAMLGLDEDADVRRATCAVRDVWEKTDEAARSELTAGLAPSSAQFVILSNCTAPSTGVVVAR